VLAVDKVYGIQKKAGYSFTMENGSISKKLVVLECVDVKNKVTRERANVINDCIDSQC